MDEYAHDGTDAAFARVYDGIIERLRGYIERRTPDSSDDFVQETFMRLVRARHRWVPGSRVLPWAFTIARNLILDAGRHDACAPFVIPEDDAFLERIASNDPPLDDVIFARTLGAAARTTLEALPVRQREAWIVVREEGLSLLDAAEALDCSEDAVRQLAHRAYRKLREALDELRRDRS